MQSQTNTQVTNDKGKLAAIMMLTLLSIAIIVVGVSFCIYSIICNVEFMVLGNLVHGAVFGLIVSFLGVRYFLSVGKLKAAIYQPTSKFSWSNFKKDI
ncbi:hypothetical protein SDC9_84010 [bioreactor metagenome]|uniref:Uncharacterized protein n=1 Tax=bioreactor metagenome TaxID=1076179 RepID=A0A644Z940_9ZZZZ|nr:hypothetical protein [Candidatus Metalachnospira sp.]